VEALGGNRPFADWFTRSVLAIVLVVRDTPSYPTLVYIEAFQMALSRMTASWLQPSMEIADLLDRRVCNSSSDSVSPMGL
jgi:hypothetical protein